MMDGMRLNKPWFCVKEGMDFNQNCYQSIAFVWMRYIVNKESNIQQASCKMPQRPLCAFNQQVGLIFILSRKFFAAVP